jgi:hypothetical protein
MGVNGGREMRMFQWVQGVGKVTEEMCGWDCEMGETVWLRKFWEWDGSMGVFIFIYSACSVHQKLSYSSLVVSHLSEGLILQFSIYCTFLHYSYSPLFSSFYYSYGAVNIAIAVACIENVL